MERAKAGIRQSLEEFRDGIEGNPDEIENRTRLMLLSWIAKVGAQHLEEIDIVGVEREITIPVEGLPGYRFTGRVDLIYRWKKQKKRGPVTIDETKTAGYSPTLTLDALYYGDQPSAYYALVERGLGLQVDCVRPDVTYWHRTSADTSKIQHYSPYSIRRTKAEIDQFMVGIAQLYMEIGQKIQAVSEGMDPHIFRRNTHYCVSFGRVCEFADICREPKVLTGKVPIGFRRVKRTLAEIDTLVLDEIVVE